MQSMDLRLSKISIVVFLAVVAMTHIAQGMSLYEKKAFYKQYCGDDMACRWTVCRWHSNPNSKLNCFRVNNLNCDCHAGESCVLREDLVRPSETMVKFQHRCMKV
ncbi:unnamed protein product [Owenia fusiformis]|uniref:Uncharacterized protein n=1 Tax=Owenia fusiformis TaxID=6347 RepID=A0A8J1TRJ7_OWEFU|nr:unnamed protein product [Owenia fusiformis]